MVSSRYARYAITLLIPMSLVVVRAAPAYACSDGMYRAGQWAEDYNSHGVRSYVQLPPDASHVQGFGTGNYMQSVGDVYVYNSDSPVGQLGFVQLGWYVGHAAQLPYVSTPHVFVGENHTGSPGGEVLRTYQQLSWGSTHAFKITHAAGDYYSFYVDDAALDATLYSHPDIDDAAFTGEVDNNGVSMWANAAALDPPYNTLQYSDGGTWYLFGGPNRFSDSADDYYSITSGGTATDLAYGSGSC